MEIDANIIIKNIAAKLVDAQVAIAILEAQLANTNGNEDTDGEA